MVQKNLKSCPTSGNHFDGLRKVHIFSSRSGARYPDVVIGLASTLKYGPSDDKAGVTPIRAQRVALAYWIRRHNRPTHVDSFLVAPDELVTTLSNLCRKYHCVWVWGGDLYRQLLAAGMFDKIGAGEPFILEADNATDNEQAGAPRFSCPALSESGVASGAKHVKTRWSGFAVLEGRVTILVCRVRGYGIMHAVDTKNIGLPDPPILCDTVLSRAEWTRDNVLRWIDWLRANGMGTLQHTISSQALYGFRANLPSIPVLVHNHQPSLGLEREALLGGRTEAFRLERITGPVYHLDFSSLYGAVAASNCVPVLWRGYAPGAVSIAPQKGIGHIADVEVDLPAPMVPFTAIVKGSGEGAQVRRYVNGEKLSAGETKQLLFPIGRFRTVICQPELDIVRPYIRAVHAAAAYQLAPLFRTWANHLWSCRVQATHAGETALAGQLKLFAQVLYGKFGQQRIGWRRAPCKSAPAPWSCWSQVNRETQEVEDWRSIAGRCEKKFRGGETYDSCPAIAAWIASLARVALWQAMEKCGRENVYYCDTDSIWTNDRGIGQLALEGRGQEPRLGCLRLVREHPWFQPIGWKHYRTTDGVTCAGLAGPGPGANGSGARNTMAEPITSACRQRRAPNAVELRSAGEPDVTYRHGLVVDGIVHPFVLGGEQ